MDTENPPARTKSETVTAMYKNWCEIYASYQKAGDLVLETMAHPDVTVEDFTRVSEGEPRARQCDAVRDIYTRLSTQLQDIKPKVLQALEKHPSFVNRMRADAVRKQRVHGRATKKEP